MSELSDWRALRLFNLYRTILSGLLVTLNSLPALGILTQLWSPTLFSVFALLYLVLSIGFSFTILLRALPRQTQFRMQILVDLIALSLLGFAAGSGSTMFAGLMLVPVTFAGFWQPGLVTQFYAALAILFMLCVTLVHRELGSPDFSFVELGALAAAQLSVGLASGLARHRDADAHAREREQELALANLTELNAYIVQRMDEGVLIVDSDNRVLMLNPAAQRILAPTRETPLALETLSPALLSAVESWRSGARLQVEAMPWRLQLTALGAGRACQLLLLLEDTRAQESRLQKEKLAALGRLTASLAHEIRNPLAAISQSAQLLEEQPALPAQDRQLLGIVRNQSARLNRMVEDILTLSRRRQPDWREVPLRSWLPALLEEWRLSWPEASAVIAFSLPVSAVDAGKRRRGKPGLGHDLPGGGGGNGGIGSDDAVEVRIDPNHLRQLLTILVDNALRHAQPAQGGLQLNIALLRLPPADTPCIELDDNGRGIPAELQQQIFEPFFSTHPQGTGLGLYLARELCAANYCELSYSAQRNCFRITFPMERPLTAGRDD